MPASSAQLPKMKGVAALTVLLAVVRLGCPCVQVGEVFICPRIPSGFPSGIPHLIMLLQDAGVLNSTAFKSENLNSVTILSINRAGITGIAEKAFRSFQNLTDLHLEGNTLSRVSTNWFRDPAVLKKLNLTGNRIEAVNESTFGGFTNLTVLSLNKNLIRTVHPNSFSSQSRLSTMDLSQNRLTRVSPQVFRPLRSLRSIRLDGNPWDCSCDTEDFVAFLKELHRRSHLDRPLNITCETPPPLKGQPVLNVSACATSPPSRPTLVTTTEERTTLSTPTARSSQRPSMTETSFQPKRTEVPSTGSSHTATLSSVRTKPTDPPKTVPEPTAKALTTSSPQPSSKTDISVQSKPTDAPTTVSSHTGTNAASSPSAQHTPVHPIPNNTETALVSSQPSKIVRRLVAVIAVLSVLLFAVCFLALLHRRKRCNKSVMPGSPKKEEDQGLSRDQSPGSSDGDLEVLWRRSLTGVRAKSANAVILTSPFGLSGKDPPSENPGEGNRNLGTESEAEGGLQMENLVATKPEREDEGGKLDENPEYVYVNADMVPYLSIGRVLNKSSPDEESAPRPDQRPPLEKVMGRISTWPPTATQWQARCKSKEEEEGDGVAVWMKNVLEKLSGEMEKIVNDGEHPTGSDQGETKEESRPSQPFKPNEPSVSEAHSHSDPETEEQPGEKRVTPDPPAVRQTRDDFCENQEKKSSETKISSMEDRKDLKREVISRRRGETGAARSKGPSGGPSGGTSGGTSPDDETLLSGNAYAFMDLLHEVSQNNGRWTRERWKQVHGNKQRR